MATPKSAIGQNIVSIVKATAPWLEPVPPSLAMLTNARFEHRAIEEACAAREVAEANSIRMLGSDETTKFGNAGITSNVVIEPTPGATLKVVVLRGAYCSAGGTAKAIANAIEIKCFLRGRDFIRRWETTCRRLYPAREQCWSAPQHSGCCARGPYGGVVALAAGNGPARGYGRWCCCLLRCRTEGITGSAAGVPRASAERSRGISSQSPLCAMRARRLIPTTAQGYRGCVLVGVDIGCGNGHIRLDGGVCVSSMDAG